MATFVGTAGADNFIGDDDVADLFEFDPAKLSASDTVRGRGGDAVDTLRLTAGGSVTTGELAGVRGIERVEMFPGSSIALTATMLATAYNGTIAVIGSTGSDTVRGNAVTDAKPINFTAKGGADTFIGGSGDDTVFVTSGQITHLDSFAGGAAGYDTLVLSSGGALAANALANLTRFEIIKLNTAGNNVTVLQSNVASAINKTLTIYGSLGDDVIDASSVTSGKLAFYGGVAGNNEFYGGAGDDAADGGSGLDSLFGGAGKDILFGHDGYDAIYGGAGADTINAGSGDGDLSGGDGVDTIIAASGEPSIYGGAGSDIIAVWTADGGRDDTITFLHENEGGPHGDTVEGAFTDHVNPGDFHLWFYQGGGEFDTNGAWDFRVFDNGSTPTGPGGPTDGADAVLYDGAGEGGPLGSRTNVDHYFAARYFAANGPGAFLAEMNADSSVTVYYDPNAFGSTGGIVILAHIENFTGSISELFGYFDVFG